ncbi:pyridoxal phosphate-dependent aminotransferase [Oenococcus kitaharae]|uniref:Aminotransferase n=1 Tax=Oenococcus kitaharae DSM 17330 TaxID=1045004 RepID=G9WG56_9LACO|nr:aminotransferase class I/II-fold pyridoxal phosphate-dependent enzyme [Oenococcus kitaharae]EHN59634.1 Aromatic amino acid aminotransferase gamma [Oenococcus kitaharae DSM 17330]OEY83478.1 aspartate aminotransferase [Oenococcus kitaharae]OEY85277.1 aspartate aminotransferase [Oenococcus kitaharae]OEY86131.1 aspartate aminotransferase [Oenococcus kitaharae]
MSKELNPLSRLVERIPHDPMLDFLDKVGPVENLIDLGFGDPDFAVGQTTKEAFKQSIDADHSHYADGQGILPLRQAACHFYNDKYACGIQGPDDILVTVGAAESINLALMAIVNPRDGVMIVEPEYSQYSNSVLLAGGQKVPVDTATSDFKLTPELIQRTYDQAAAQGIKVIAIIVNYPNNPTGSSYNLDELTALANTFEKLNLWVLSDEIYAEQTFKGSHHSLYAIIPERTILITGLSKSHSMTGYRLGFVIAHGAVMTAMRKIQDTLVTCVATPIQEAAASALTLDPDAGIKTRSRYLMRVSKVAHALTDLGFHADIPTGAFYVWAKIPDKFGDDAFPFCVELAQKAGVQIFPGSIFSDTAKAYVRISCAGADKDLDTAINRLSAYLKKPA